MFRFNFFFLILFSSLTNRPSEKNGEKQYGTKHKLLKMSCKKFNERTFVVSYLTLCNYKVERSPGY